MLDNIDKSDYLIIAGDLNARIGVKTIDNLIEPRCEIEIIKNGVCLWEFCAYNKLRVTNTFFIIQESKKFRWSELGLKSIIDSVIINTIMWPHFPLRRVYEEELN